MGGLSPIALAVIQALFTLGPQALNAIDAVVRAAHDHPVSEDDHAVVGRAIMQAIARKDT